MAFFPALTLRLAAALKQTGVQRHNLDLACRHFLCAEALAEVLEARIQDGRGRRGDARDEVVNEYTARVPAKLREFHRRPAAERRAIQAAYPEVDLVLVRRAFREKKLKPEFVAGVLEDPIDYQGLLRTMQKAAPPA